MRSRCRLFVLALLVTGAAFPSTGGAALRATVTKPAASGQAFVGGQVIVRFAPAAGVQARLAARAAADATFEQSLPLRGMQLLHLGPGASVADAVARLEARPDVLYAQPNYILRPEKFPNDPKFGEQWALHNTGQVIQGQPGNGAVAGTSGADIHAPEAWDTTTGSDAVTIAIIDTGVAFDERDLAPNIWTNPGETGGGREANGVDDDHDGFVDDWRGWDFGDNDNVPQD